MSEIIKEVGALIYTDNDGIERQLLPEIETDTSLSASGKAADAATVGERFRTIESIAKGANQSLVYATYEEMVAAVNVMDNTILKTGQGIYIGTVEVPDLWVYSVEETSNAYTYTDDVTLVSELSTSITIQIGYYKLAQLETQKVDLSEYAKQTDVESLQNTNAEILAKLGVDGIEVVSALPSDAADNVNTLYLIVGE